MKATKSVQSVLVSLVLATGADAQTSPTPVGSYVARSTNPYYYTGRVLFTTAPPRGGLFGVPKQGTGTVIKPYSVLTAAHCLYGVNGWSYNIRFERGRYNSAVSSTSYASRPLVLAGYAGAVSAYGTDSSSAFNRDLGAFTCTTRPDNGGYAGWWPNTTLLTGSAYNMSLGYGSQFHNGVQLLRSAPTRGFTSVTPGWYRNTSYTIEGGMSGGPVFASQNGWWVCAVNVSGNGSRTGVRIIDNDASTLIRNQLY